MEILEYYLSLSGNFGDIKFYFIKHKPCFMKMKHLTFLFGFLLVVSFVSCKKSETTNPNPPGGDTTTNSNGTLKFLKLEAQDTLLKVNDVTTITATATGTELSYKWTAQYGTFIGSGNTVQWTVCHSDKFRITCEIRDNSNHSDTRDVYITTHE